MRPSDRLLFRLILVAVLAAGCWFHHRGGWAQVSRLAAVYAFCEPVSPDCGRFTIVRFIDPAAPEKNGDWAFCILTVGEQLATVAIDWASREVDDELSGRRTDFATVNYRVKDLWNASTKPFTTLVMGKGKLRKQLVQNPATAVVGSHDVAVYRLTPVTGK